jgi:hypothetical protein
MIATTTLALFTACSCVLHAACMTPLVASLAGRVPGIFFGLPLVALASLIFAATHHEDPAAIRLAAVHWTVWLGGMLGMVLAAVLLLGLLQ